MANNKEPPFDIEHFITSALLKGEEMVADGSMSPDELAAMKSRVPNVRERYLGVGPPDWCDAFNEQFEKNIARSDAPKEEKDRLMSELRDPKFLALLRLNGPPEMLSSRKVGENGKYISELGEDELSMLRQQEKSARDQARRMGFSADNSERATGKELDGIHAEGGKTLNKICSKYGRDPAFSDEFQEAMMLNAVSISMENLGVTKTALGDDCAKESLRAQACWARNGLPFVQIKDPVWAASLGATSMPPELAEFVRPPWSAFRISVPRGLLSVETDDGTDGAEPCTRLMVMLDKENEWTIVLYGTRHMMHITGESTTGLCEDVNVKKRNVAHDPGFRLTGRDGRVMRIATRLVLAVCSSMDSAQRKGRPKTKREKRKARCSPTPTINEYVLRPSVRVNTDVREALREYVAGERKGSPKVQSLIRGHWKNQPCGPGGTERKFIHIEPYWRGPEDAPIAVRPHILSGEPKTAGANR